MESGADLVSDAQFGHRFGCNEDPFQVETLRIPGRGAPGAHAEPNGQRLPVLHDDHRRRAQHHSILGEAGQTEHDHHHQRADGVHPGGRHQRQVEAFLDQSAPNGTVYESASCSSAPAAQNGRRHFSYRRLLYYPGKAKLI